MHFYGLIGTARLKCDSLNMGNANFEVLSLEVHILGQPVTDFDSVAGQHLYISY